MQYDLNTTEEFDVWLSRLDNTLKRRLANRFVQVMSGNFGDHKVIAANLFEVRCFFGGGLRVYYTVRDNRIVLLLAGGDKSSQVRDIAKAAAMVNELQG